MQQERKFDKNQFIGFALIAVLMAAFFYINQPSEEELRELQQKEQLAAQQEQNIPEAAQVDSARTSVQTPADTTAKSVQPKDYAVENPKIKATFSGKGGYISELLLKEFSAFDSAAKDHKRPLYIIKDGNNEFNLKFKDKSGNEINTAQLAFSPSVQNAGSKKIVTMNAALAQGSLQYVYTFGEDYSIGFEIKSEGIHQITSDKNLAVEWDMNALSVEKGKQQEDYWAQTYFRFKGTNDVEYELFGADEWEEEEAVDWIAFKQQFFSSILSFDEGFLSPAGNSKPIGETNPAFSKNYNFQALIPVSGSELNYKMQWDFVPLDYRLLTQDQYEGKDFGEIIPFGWGFLGWINKHFFLNIFQWLATTGINYGWVILLMTIVVKLVLSPIMYKQYRQSAMMRILRPELNELTEKFKGKENAMKKQQATMELYRKAGVNPLSGCLPALIQIPIFYALFRFFPNIIDLRGESFLWAEDLTAYDSPILIPDWVPMMDGHISILALSYIIAMVVYFKVSGSLDSFNQPPQEGMPDMRIMKYMMYVMPVFFFVFLNSYASGLSWYYLVSNVINIGIVMFIKNVMIDDKKIHAKIQENKAKPKKPSKWGAKMQQLMEQAQEQQKLQEKKKGKKK
ncbi:MAG: membrane protein insertase YidC [Moheibacter sp.]